MKKKCILSHKETKTILTELENPSWRLDTIPTHRDDIEIPCLKFDKDTIAIIYLNQTTGQFNLLAEDSSLRQCNKGCIPTYTHNMVIGSGTKLDVLRYVDEYRLAAYHEGINKFQEMFDKIKKDQKKC